MAGAGDARLLRFALVCAGVVLALDSLALARRLDLLPLPGEMGEAALARRSGQAVATRLARSARQSGVADAPAVSRALADLETALGLAASAGDVARALGVEARAAEDAIAAARAGLPGPAPAPGDERALREAISVLQDETRALRDELAAMRRAAGMDELAGPGVIVRAYDAPDGYRNREIVHERDVQDILNALFYAGARGAEVGGQRIVAQSSVRCAGPILLVNQQPVPSNPVVVKAVGDPDSLRAALGEIERRFARDGKRLAIEDGEAVLLGAYSRAARM